MLVTCDAASAGSSAAGSPAVNGIASLEATGALQLDGGAFRDGHGRQVLLRGLNFGGDCKLPVSPNGHSYLPSDFSDHRTVSFVGRPAPLADIDGHLARIAHWGFNCLRLVTTWEAVEHAGPGEYDEAYLDYFAEVCSRAGQHGLHVFIDFHQDVWSRMSGGDGAPGWTFEAAGLDFTKFHIADAAFVMQHNYDHRLGGRQASYPTMSWGGNYARPANGIMWTLFFAGADFAPTARVDGVNIQHFLQNHYIGAMRAVAERVAHLDNVVGFDTLNEPGTGYIGKGMSDPILRGHGTLWSPLEGMAVASGISRELPELALGKGVVGTRNVNIDSVPIWLPGHHDPFRQAGAWDLDIDGKPVALIPDYFQSRSGHKVEHERDYMVPFFNKVADTVRAVRADWLVFAEVDPFDAAQGRGFPDGMPDRAVNASHWYDITALVTKRFNAEHMVHAFTGEIRDGEQAIEEAYVRELSVLKDAGATLNGGAPTLIGECGIQYDMNDAQAYDRWGSGERSPEIWHAQTTALDLMYNAFDRLLISSTQWNYTVSNRNDSMIGDGWNQEDLSIWSIDQSLADDPNSGGRAIEGFCRPYIRSAQGTIISQRFDRRTGLFLAEIQIDTRIDAPTEIYAPQVQYRSGCHCEVSQGDAEWRGQLLHVHAAIDGILSVRLERR
jgi:hypothetical protein